LEAFYEWNLIELKEFEWFSEEREDVMRRCVERLEGGNQGAFSQLSPSKPLSLSLGCPDYVKSLSTNHFLHYYVRTPNKV
jgi:hypothetical protein